MNEISGRDQETRREHEMMMNRPNPSGEVAPIPVTVLTGFLGSGKTTLLNHVLRSEELERTLVIVNEFGEIGLDHMLIEQPADETILLENGCLCCSALGDLVLTLTGILLRRDRGELPPFGRIIVETTGLADPAPLLQTILADPNVSTRVRLEGVVTVVDAVNAVHEFRNHFEAVKQVAVADKIVVSKTDLATPGQVAGVIESIKAINAGAELFVGPRESHSVRQLFEAPHQQRRWSAWLCDEPAEESSGSARKSQNHYQQNGIESLSLRQSEPASQEGLRLWLNAVSRFKGPELLRLKGIINVEGRPVVVQAVQSTFHEPEELAAWPSAKHETQIVFITRGIDAAEIEATLSTLQFLPASGSVGPLSFDTSDYARFIEAIRNFGSMERV